MSVEADLPIGTELAGYRVKALVGRGGMGVVYQALDLALDRPVALKILAPELADDVQFRERFLRESRLAASIDHPNIVPVYDAGEVAGELYIAMRYVEGQNLKQLLDSDPLEPERAIALVSQIAAALDAAHARGLVHRDVKPSNVLVTSDGHVYLADFGLTRRLGETALADDPARSLGTADYVAPEQIRGDDVDGRADLYSLGCVLYECLTGRPPFQRDSEVATLFAHLEEESPTQPGLEMLMRTALAKEPDRRYQSGEELVEATRTALGLEPKRVRWPLAIAAIGVALLGASALAFFLTSGGGGAPAEAGADTLVRISPTSNTVSKTMPVGPLASGVAVDSRYVWVTSAGDGTLWRIDPNGGQPLKLVAKGTPIGVASDGQKVIVADGPEHQIASFYAASGQLDYTSTLRGQAWGSLLVAAGDAGSWFGDESVGIVGKVDEVLSGGGTPSEQVAIPPDRHSFFSIYNSFDGLAVGQGSVWVEGDPFDRSIWRVDPATQAITRKVHLPFIPDAITVGDGAVWVSSLLGDTVSRIDPRTNRIVATVHVGRGPDAIASGNGSVWVTSSIDDQVWRIDPRTNRVIAVVPVGGRPTAIGVDASGAWVTTTPWPPPAPRGTIKIGIQADCTGAFGSEYEPSLAGAELPLVVGGGHPGAQPSDGISGVSIDAKPVRVYFACASRGSSTYGEDIQAVRQLVERDGVQAVIGPTAGDADVLLQQYARRHPTIAFLDGSGGDPLQNPPSNMFTFNPDSAQAMAGLGAYAYRQLGWRTAVLMTDETYGIYGWASDAAFMAEFCSLGGKIVKRVWLPSGLSDLSGVVSRLPQTGVDGFVVTSTPPRTKDLADAYPALRGNISRKVVLASATASEEIAALGKRLTGVVTAGPTLFLPGGVPGRSQRRLSRYRALMRDAFPQVSPTLIGGGFDLPYNAAMTGLLSALDRVHGDLSHGGRRFMAALANTTVDSPFGRITLDSRHRAITENRLYRLEVQRSTPRAQVIRTIPNVEPSFGGYFKPTDPPPSESSPACVKRTPPPWAR